MISILLCITSGILIGYLFRKKNVLKYTGTLLNGVIMLLLFFLGVSVGDNDQIIRNITNVGLQAFMLTVGGTLGSLFCAKWVYNRFFAGKRIKSEKNASAHLISNETPDRTDDKISL